MPELDRLRYGSDEPLPEKLPLRAGPLSLVFENGDIRYIRFGGREVLRRVYMAVRDRNWNTVPNAISNLSIRSSEDGFAIGYDVVSRLGEIDFRWSATIAGDANGTVEWTMRGKAHSTFWRNRLGYCVLHPIRECAGLPCAIETADGSIENARFPKQISPHQPFRNLRAMSHEVVPGLTAEVRFSGEIFETEDQRNWTDASYKTYSTPLDLPFPVEVKEGTVVSQSVRLSLIGGQGEAPSAGGPNVFSYREDAALLLPELGLGQASHGARLSDTEIARLRALNLSHLRADLDLTKDCSGALAGAVRDARALDVPLELAIAFCDEAQLAEFAAMLAADVPRVRRWLVFHPCKKATPVGWVALARRHLSAAAPGAAFAAGTNAYFAELNRERPACAELDAVCFSLNPQVHAFDNDSLVENVAAQADAVESARRIAGSKPVAVSPVTLRPRFNPNATAAEPEPEPGKLPPEVDVRQQSLFGAAWTAGSLKYLAESGAASVTLYETCGRRGVMEAARVFPLYHVLADAGEFAGGEVLRSHSSDALAVDGFVLRKGSRMRVVLANMRCAETRVAVEGLGRGARLKRLDETNAERAMAAPEAFRAEAGEALQTAGRTELTLAPYAVLRIDFEAREP
jgi:hypothetical protein